VNIEQRLTSLEVAEMVGKSHDKLLRDIRNYIPQLGEAKIGESDFFTESTYQNSQNKTQPCYDVSKKGCEFIAHKLTGIKGTEFTAKYITKFHEMEQEIADKKPLSAMEQLKLQSKALIEVDEKVENLANDFNAFKNDMPILALECERITNAKNRKVVGLMGGKDSNAYNNNSLRSKVYRDVDSQLRREFGIKTYKAIKRNQCEKAIETIENYQLPTYLQEQVSNENNQMRLM
jgi:Rha family phage regulatory protein